MSAAVALLTVWCELEARDSRLGIGYWRLEARA